MHNREFIFPTKFVYGRILRVFCDCMCVFHAIHPLVLRKSASILRESEARFSIFTFSVWFCFSSSDVVFYYSVLLLKKINKLYKAIFIITNKLNWQKKVLRIFFLNLILQSEKWKKKNYFVWWKTFIFSSFG